MKYIADLHIQSLFQQALLVAEKAREKRCSYAVGNKSQHLYEVLE